MDIGWCHTQGNVIKGTCPFECEVTKIDGKNRCYAHTREVRFKRENTPLKLNLEIFEKWKKLKPARIFVNSTLEWFHPKVMSALGKEELWDGVYSDWLYQIFERMERDEYSHHAYIVLTKLPLNAVKFFNIFHELRNIKNLMICTSVSSAEYEDRISHLREIKQRHKGVSFEPLLASPFDTYHPLEGMEWAIVGGLSHGHRCIKKYEPKEEWLDLIIDESLNTNTDVYIKHNAFFNWNMNMREHAYNCKEIPGWMP